MAFSPGARLGPYEIVGPLGAGGMGEVYRACDPRLDRDVAIKVLPEDVASDPDRLRRFEKEARAAGSLNHLNILIVHDVGTHEGRPYLVTELLEGETLRERMAAAALPSPKAIDYAVQIARGLAAAHDKGIVHRDLKPENLFVTKDGPIRILDFGLAKLRGLEGQAHDSGHEVETVSRATDTGAVMGTAGYMSPEQVRGQAVDHRSDIFTFGAVLYEMLSGKRAFHGGSAVEVQYAILTEQPPRLLTTGQRVPLALERVVRRCLEKRPEERFASSQGLMEVLESLWAPSREETPGLESVARPAARVGRRHRTLPWLSGAILGVVGVLVGWVLSTRAPEAPAVPVEITPFTTDGGAKRWPRLSPDAEKVAYSWSGPADDNWDIYVKARGPGTKPLRLTEDPAPDVSPVWSPDGRRIAFVRGLQDGAAIYTLPWLGEQERRLIDVSGPVLVQFDYFLPALAWSPDGEWLTFAERPTENGPARIVRLRLETLEKQPLTSPPRDTLGDFHPAFSPDGSQLAFVRSGSGDYGDLDVWVQPVEGSGPRRLTSREYEHCYGLTWTPDGTEILFTAGRTRRILRVSLEGGEPRPVAGVGWNAAGASIRGSRMVYEQRAVQPQDIWRIPGRKTPLPDRAPGKLIVSSQEDNNPAYSPDGRKIAFSSYRRGISNIWVCDSDGTNPVQLTDFENHTGTPRWSPDGRRLAFDSLEAGDWNLYVLDADGGSPRRLTHEPSAEFTGTWSRDGRWIYFYSDRSGSGQIWKITPEGGHAVQITHGGGYYAEESWDGRRLYYCKVTSAGGVWQVPVAGGEETEVVPGPVSWNSWALSESGIYYATQREQLRDRRWEYTIHFLDLESGQVTDLLRKEGPFSHRWLAVSPEEEWILFGESPAVQSELMLMEDFR